MQVAPHLSYDVPPPCKAPETVFLVHSWNCLYTNAQSLMNKIPELRFRCSLSQPALIGVTETWLGQDTLDSEVSIPGYTLLRGDRKDRRGEARHYMSWTHS